MFTDGTAEHTSRILSKIKIKHSLFKNSFVAALLSIVQAVNFDTTAEVPTCVLHLKLALLLPFYPIYPQTALMGFKI